MQNTVSNVCMYTIITSSIWPSKWCLLVCGKNCLVLHELLFLDMYLNIFLLHVVYVYNVLMWMVSCMHVVVFSSSLLHVMHIIIFLVQYVFVAMKTCIYTWVWCVYCPLFQSRQPTPIHWIGCSITMTLAAMILHMTNTAWLFQALLFVVAAWRTLGSQVEFENMPNVL